MSEHGIFWGQETWSAVYSSATQTGVSWTLPPIHVKVCLSLKGCGKGEKKQRAQDLSAVVEWEQWEGLPRGPLIFLKGLGNPGELLQIHPPTAKKKKAVFLAQFKICNIFPNAAAYYGSIQINVLKIKLMLLHMYAVGEKGFHLLHFFGQPTAATQRHLEDSNSEGLQEYI